MYYDLHNDVVTYDKDFKKRYKEFTDSGFSPVLALYYDGKNYKYLEKTFKKNVGKYFFGLENVDYGDDKNIISMLKLKPLYASLTWNYENRLSGGCKTDVGLKDKGREIIRQINYYGVAVDTAHLSRNAFDETVELAETVINSHTAFNGVHYSARNLSDGQIRSIISKGGIIGLCFYSPFLSDGRVTVTDAVRHADYFLQKFGDDNLCIGSDYYGAEDFPKGLKSYRDYDGFTERLKVLGYSDRTINKISRENFIKFLTVFKS